MLLLKAPIVKNHLTLAGFYFIFLKKHTRKNLKRLSIPNLDFSEKIAKIVTNKEQILALI